MNHGRGDHETLIACVGERQTCISDKARQYKHTTPDSVGRWKSLGGESGMRGADPVTPGGAEYRPAVRKGSFCHYIHILFSITVCQTATNELISIF